MDGQGDANGNFGPDDLVIDITSNFEDTGWGQL